MKRYTVEEDGNNRAILTIHAGCWLGDAGDVRCFWAGFCGGYVYEVTPERPGTSGTLIGDGLSHKGNLLCLDVYDTMADLVRREARRCLRAEKRAL